MQLILGACLPNRGTVRTVLQPFYYWCFPPTRWGKQGPLPPHLPTTRPGPTRQAPTTPPVLYPRKAPRWTPAGAGPKKGAGPRLTPPLQYPEAATARGGEDPPALWGAGTGALARRLPPSPKRLPGSRRGDAAEPAELAGRLPPDVR